jgi:glycerophosphoryl diester phosphodiesterase
MIVYISFDYDMVKKLVSLSRHVPVQYLNGDRSPAQLAKDGISGADYHFTVFKKNTAWIREARENNIRLNAWTVNDTTTMNWLLAEKFDFITTNEPELLLMRLERSTIAD